MSQLHLHAGSVKFLEAQPTDERVGIDGGDDAARDLRGDQGVGTGAGTAVMRAGFQRDVRRGAADAVAE